MLASPGVADRGRVLLCAEAVVTASVFASGAVISAVVIVYRDDDAEQSPCGSCRHLLHALSDELGTDLAIYLQHGVRDRITLTTAHELY